MAGRETHASERWIVDESSALKRSSERWFLLGGSRKAAGGVVCGGRGVRQCGVWGGRGLRRYIMGEGGANKEDNFSCPTFSVCPAYILPSYCCLFPLPKSYPELLLADPGGPECDGVPWLRCPLRDSNAAGVGSYDLTLFSQPIGVLNPCTFIPTHVYNTFSHLYLRRNSAST